MASIFSFQEEPPRIHSPWSTPGNTTPRTQTSDNQSSAVNGIKKLDPERHDGPCEYKLHLLLRPRRKFLSTSTTSVIPDLGQAKPTVMADSPRSMSEFSLQRVLYHPSSSSRKARLQQLTTQLLWRLQQSSPFHSSSNADLVLPVLPEATPRLGVPDRPAKLLPGLEESQGALYEIGVADDGTLVGLVDEELDESLGNLRAMASSLGCVVEVLRRVQVGSCEWADIDEASGELHRHADKLFVAEVLVRPDSRATPEIILKDAANNDQTEPNSGSLQDTLQHEDTEQIRVALAGASSAGKSTLSGTLTTSKLDNGRGKSRLSLLKHRHEIASGITSSVAQELLGYCDPSNSESDVVNYSSGDVSAWTDIHNLASRLVFLSDSPGLPRYSKSTFRSLVSWKPHWTVFCVAADDTDYCGGNPPALLGQNEVGYLSSVNMSIAYLEMCLRLNLPLVLTITKMDLATRAGLRAVLSQVLSTLKAAGRKPVVLSNASVPGNLSTVNGKDAIADMTFVSATEQEEIQRVLHEVHENSNIVPIVITSSVTGSGLGKLHFLLKTLPIIQRPTIAVQDSGLLRFQVDEVFSIPPSRVYSTTNTDVIKHQGIVLCGYMQHGRISIGDILRLGPFLVDDHEFQPPIHRSKSCSSHEIRIAAAARSLSGTFTKSYQDDTNMKSVMEKATKVAFVTVRVVSLRNLRLPVVTMLAGETGTIGVEPEDPREDTSLLQRTRKGMILTRQDFPAYRSFTARFPASDFASAFSPPLILGGQAIVYINSVRATVKVTAVALADSDRTEPSSPEIEVFTFDGDDSINRLHSGSGRTGLSQSENEIKVSFRFSSTVECFDMGDQVLVVPTFNTISGPNTSGLSSASNTTSPSGLAGFVGYICDAHT